MQCAKLISSLKVSHVVSHALTIKDIMSTFSPRNDTPQILAIAGGSCSGKSTLAAYLRDYIGAKTCRVVRQDDYYHDIRERGGSPMVNFDIPKALDFDLLRENLLAFKRNEAVVLPHYDFTTHQRRTPSEPRNPRPLIVVEGILLLAMPKLREVFDHSVYIRCASELRLSRRLERDTTERGRSREDVLRQFHDQVEPAHQEFVSPSQTHAHLILEQTQYISNMTEVAQSILALVNG